MSKQTIEFDPDALPESLKRYKTFEDLVKGAENAQSLLGRSIQLPKEGEEDEFLNRLQKHDTIKTKLEQLEAAAKESAQKELQTKFEQEKAERTKKLDEFFNSDETKLEKLPKVETLLKRFNQDYKPTDFDPEVVDLLASVAQSFKESGTPPVPTASSSDLLKELMASKAYHNASHPDHHATVRQVVELANKLNP